MNLRLELEDVIEVIEDQEKPCSEIVCLLRNLLKNYDEEWERIRKIAHLSSGVEGAGTG